MLTNNQSAPDFSLTAADGSLHTLSQYQGKPLILLFLRGEFCPTTRRYLLEWQDMNRRFHTLKAALLAMSADPVSVQADFQKTYNLRFPFLSDPEAKTAQAYGAYLDRQKSGALYSEPALVILNGDGTVAYSLISSGPKGLPGPEYVFNILIYMFAHGGQY